MLYFYTRGLNGAYMEARQREDFIHLVSQQQRQQRKTKRRFAAVALNELR